MAMETGDYNSSKDASRLNEPGTTYRDPGNIYYKLTTAIKSGDLDTFISLLVNPEVDLTKPLHKGNILLHLASSHNNLQILQILLSCTVNPDIINKFGKAPYDLALSKEFRDEFMFRFPDNADNKQAVVTPVVSPVVYPCHNPPGWRRNLTETETWRDTSSRRTEKRRETRMRARLSGSM